MHQLLQPAPRPRHWPPQLSSLWVRMCGPLRRFAQKRFERIHSVDFRGMQHLQTAINSGHGLLVTPNHCTYSDPYLIYDAVDRVGTAAYFMTAWQVFGQSNPFKQSLLQKHGAFSIDRDGTDRQAFRIGVEILQSRREPLVIFPEGEMYHLGDQVTPFQEGAAAIAHAAARKTDRTIVCVPCGLKYYSLIDPIAQWMRLLHRLETALFWSPRPDLSIVERIYRLAEGILALKEIEYRGATSTGPLPARLTELCDHLLRGLEQRYQRFANGTVPQRIKRIRGHLVQRLSEPDASSDEVNRLNHDLDELFLALQLFCYPGDYVLNKPSTARISETLAKLEEDILKVPLSRPLVPQGAIVEFGEPIAIDPAANKKNAVSELTDLLEERVQALLDSIQPPEPVLSRSVT